MSLAEFLTPCEKEELDDLAKDFRRRITSFADSGMTERDIAAYFEEVLEWSKQSDRTRDGE